MYKYTILSATEFKIENKAKNFKINYIGDEALAISETAKFNTRLLNENKKAKQTQLISYMDSQKNLMTASYSAISVESFTDKRNEAMSWRVNSTVATPYVDSLNTDSAGVLDTVARDAQLSAILAKVDAIARLEAFEDATRTAIKACTTQAELDAIVIP